MSVLIRFDPPSLTAEQYDQTVRKLEEAGEIPADGLEIHVCFGSDGNLKVSEVWDSQEQLDAFGETLRPVLDEAGIDPGEPEILQIHNIIRR
jgi:allophanate hydrolase subunit 1